MDDDLDRILTLAGLTAKETLNEVSPPKWEGTVKAMKKHKEITNPWALSWYMKNKGYHSHKTKTGKPKRESVDEASDSTTEGMFLQQMGDAVDSLLNAKDTARALGYPIEDEISELAQRIHGLQNTHVPHFNESVEEDAEEPTEVDEKWDTDYETPESKKGMWKGWSKERLEKRRNALRKKETRTPAETTTLRQINFALRAKSDWGKA